MQRTKLPHLGDFRASHVDFPHGFAADGSFHSENLLLARKFKPKARRGSTQADKAFIGEWLTLNRRHT